MGFLKNLFLQDRLKNSWDSFISDTPNSKNLILVVNNFFIRDRINVQKFAANYRIIEMLSNGQKKYEIISLVGTKVFEEYFSNDTWMTKVGMGVQNWFVAAYPDAYIWFQKNYDTYKDEANRIFEANQSGNAIPHAFYRFVINSYVFQGFKLECTN